MLCCIPVLSVAITSTEMLEQKIVKTSLVFILVKCNFNVCLGQHFIFTCDIQDKSEISMKFLEKSAILETISTIFSWFFVDNM